MNDEIDNTPIDALQTLKNKADSIRMKYHPSIGLAKLQEKFALVVAQNAKATEAIAVDSVSTELTAEEIAAKRAAHLAAMDAEFGVVPSEDIGTGLQMSESQKRYLFATELLRVRIIPLSDIYKNMVGEYFCILNRDIGRVKKWAQFNTPGGWHYPRCLVEFLESKTFQAFYEYKNKAGRIVKSTREQQAFSIQYLPKLSVSDLKVVTDGIRTTEEDQTNE